MAKGILTISSANPASAIQRLTPDQRLAMFEAQADSIYTEQSPYDGQIGGINGNQPYIYTFINDPWIERNFTRFDTQASPIGSLVRDTERIGDFISSGMGTLFMDNQANLQFQNAFTETQTFDPDSILSAVSRDLGDSYPQRHLDTSDGSTTIPGSATGEQGLSPFANYATVGGGASAGALRGTTGNTALSLFSSIWVSGPGGYLANQGAAANSAAQTWVYRPEYPDGGAGIYNVYLSDASNGQFLTENNRPIWTQLYNGNQLDSNKGLAPGEVAETSTATVNDFHKYTSDFPYIPGTSPNGTTVYDDAGAVTNNGKTNSAILKNLALILTGTPSTQQNPVVGQTLQSAERYNKVSDNNDKGYGHAQTSYPAYSKIPSGNRSAAFYTSMINLGADVLEQNKMFSGRGVIASTITASYDRYNALTTASLGGGSRKDIPLDLLNDNQSTDLIFFYFYDLVNNIYIPFRATIGALSDQHSAEWEDVTYMGRADKLFVYKGFSRDINFSFTVYANSIIELIPMWTRINYLVGLTRPSKYTTPAVQTNTETSLSGQTATTGAESQFIYPPMVTIRVGDLFVDQPCVITSVGVNIPDDTSWETYRGSDYEYLASPIRGNIQYNGTPSRQLPLKADISIAMKVMEKTQALTSADHYGYNMAL